MLIVLIAAHCIGFFATFYFCVNGYEDDTFLRRWSLIFAVLWPLYWLVFIAAFLVWAMKGNH